jgi:hypothetical protein
MRSHVNLMVSKMARQYFCRGTYVALYSPLGRYPFTYREIYLNLSTFAMGTPTLLVFGCFPLSYLPSNPPCSRMWDACSEFCCPLCDISIYFCYGRADSFGLRLLSSELSSEQSAMQSHVGHVLGILLPSLRYTRWIAFSHHTLRNPSSSEHHLLHLKATQWYNLMDDLSRFYLGGP